MRQQMIIDQSPPPLYCSDECRMLDMQSAADLDFNYNPEHHGSSAVASTTSSCTVAEQDSGDSSIGSSPESEPSSVSARVLSPAPTSTQRKSRLGPIPTGYAALASFYDLPPCPPPPPFQPDPKPKSDKHNPADEYTSGVIMAARRIQSMLGPQEKKKPSWSAPASKLSTAYANDAYAYSGTQPQREVIPGWTDGSDSFARPDEDVAVSADGDFDNRNNAYRGFVSTPCRSRGVYSTMGELKEGEAIPERMQRIASQPVTRARSEAEELHTKWDMPVVFARRCESRTSTATLFSTSLTGSTHSLPTYASRKSRGILKKGAEGKLLVPNVQMKRADLMTSLERLSLSKQESQDRTGMLPQSRLAKTENASGSSGGSVATDEEDEVKDTIMSLDFKPRRARSPPMSSEPWYKDEQFTYPVLTIPRKEKQLVTKVVNVKEVVEEVTVNVCPERKRLFLFPGRAQN